MGVDRLVVNESFTSSWTTHDYAIDDVSTYHRPRNASVASQSIEGVGTVVIIIISKTNKEDEEDERVIGYTLNYET